METLNNFLIYALQSPKKRHNLYVGQTKDYKERMRLHKKANNCVDIRDAVKEYGWKNMKQFVLIEGLTKEQADWYEQHYISIFDCQAPRGYNLTSGGKKSLYCQVSRDRMSAKMKGHTHGKGRRMPPRTAEQRAKNSVAMMGDKNPMKRPEVKANHAAAANRPEVKARKSAKAKGQNNPNSKTNRRRRFIAKCFDGGVFDEV